MRGRRASTVRQPTVAMTALVTVAVAIISAGVVAATAGARPHSTRTETTSRVVPATDAVLVHGAPISIATVDHWMYVAEKGNTEEHGGPVIVPVQPPTFSSCIKQVRARVASARHDSDTRLRQDCRKLFTTLSAVALDFLIKGHWYELDAAALGIRETTAEVQSAFRAEERTTFPTTRDLHNYEARTGQTLADLYLRVRVHAIYEKLIAHYRPTAGSTVAAENEVNRVSRADWRRSTICRSPYASTDCTVS